MGWHAPGETQDLNQKPRLDNMQPYYFTLPKLKLSIRAVDYVAPRLSCKALPETLQKHHVLPETQLRTLAIRAAPRQLGAAIVLSGVSPNGLEHFKRNKATKPETPLR